MSGTPQYDGTLSFLIEALRDYLPVAWRIRCRLSITLPDGQHVPDFAIVRGLKREFMTRHPCPADIGIVGEVADASMLHEKRAKAHIYARFAIPVYWIINLQDQRIEVHSQPSGPTAEPKYNVIANYTLGDVVPLDLKDYTVTEIPTDNLLP